MPASLLTLSVMNFKGKLLNVIEAVLNAFLRFVKLNVP